MRRKEQAEVEPRSCQETNKGKTHNKNKRKTERKQKQGKKEGKPAKNPPSKQTKRNRGQASEKPLFDSVVEGSDAESKVGQRLSGAPPWETQREYTNELIGSDLVEHEKLGRHP